MSFDVDSLETMKTEVESILRRDKRFGSLHRIETAEDDNLVLIWTEELRRKAKANPGPYLQFMEEIDDCLANFGYCLAADDGASETERNNYMLIVPEDDSDFDD